MKLKIMFNITFMLLGGLFGFLLYNNIVTRTELNEAILRLSEQPKYEQMYNLSKQEVNDYRDSLRKSDSCYRYTDSLLQVNYNYDAEQALKINKDIKLTLNE